MEKQTENEKINSAGKYLKSIAISIIGTIAIAIIQIISFESLDLRTIFSSSTFDDEERIFILCQLLNLFLGIRIIFCLYKAGNNLISYKEKEEK